MPLTILTGRNAVNFAEKYNPVVVQYTTGNDPRDNIELFYGGVFDGCKTPVAYYAVKRDEIRRYTIAYYHWYHRLDWGGAADFLGGNIDRHPGDFEGCAICVPDDDKEPSYILTRAHHHILKSKGWFNPRGIVIAIESKGHGCRFIAWPEASSISECRVYPYLDLVPLYVGEWYSAVAADMQLQFQEWGTVDWPDQFEDLKTKLRGIRNVGDYWNDPLKLVAKMEDQIA